MSNRNELIQMAMNAGIKSNTKNSRSNMGYSTMPNLQSYNMNIPMSQQNLQMTIDINSHITNNFFHTILIPITSNMGKQYMSLYNFINIFWVNLLKEVDYNIIDMINIIIEGSFAKYVFDDFVKKGNMEKIGDIDMHIDINYGKYMSMRHSIGDNIIATVNSVIDKIINNYNIEETVDLIKPAGKDVYIHHIYIKSQKDIFKDPKKAEFELQVLHKFQSSDNVLGIPKLIIKPFIDNNGNFILNYITENMIEGQQYNGIQTLHNYNEYIHNVDLFKSIYKPDDMYRFMKAFMLIFYNKIIKNLTNFTLHNGNIDYEMISNYEFMIINEGNNGVLYKYSDFFNNIISYSINNNDMTYLESLYRSVHDFLEKKNKENLIEIFVRAIILRCLYSTVNLDIVRGKIVSHIIEEYRKIKNGDKRSNEQLKIIIIDPISTLTNEYSYKSRSFYHNRELIGIKNQISQKIFNDPSHLNYFFINNDINFMTNIDANLKLNEKTQSITNVVYNIQKNKLDFACEKTSKLYRQIITNINGYISFHENDTYIYNIM